MTDRTCLETARTALKRSRELQEAAGRELATASQALETVLETTVERDLNIPFNSDKPATDHRKEHRFGPPPKIASDPELEAFIRARIDHLTFVQIAAEIAATFPEPRRVGKSTIHKWWHQTGKHSKPANPHPR